MAFELAMIWIASAARLVVWLLTKSSNLMLGPIGDKTTFAEGRLSPAELRGLVAEATETGRRIVLEHPHSRLPVYASTIDDVIGYVLYKDLLPLAWEAV